MSIDLKKEPIENLYKYFWSENKGQRKLAASIAAANQELAKINGNLKAIQDEIDFRETEETTPKKEATTSNVKPMHKSNRRKKN